MIPTERASFWGNDGTFRARLELEDERGLVDRLDPALVLRVEPGEIELDLSRYAGGRPTRRENYLAPTFLVDHDDERIAEWVDGLEASLGANPSLPELVTAVRSVISEDPSNGFLPASEVLRRGIGDCTEHALLFAAISRALSIPTRVVTGIVLVDVDGAGIQAFGHAWNEVECEGRWALLDATPITGGRAVAYVPSNVLENEGPGYVRELLDWQAGYPRSVRVIGRPPESGPATLDSRNRPALSSGTSGACSGAEFGGAR